jgi:hypothetical protein
LPSEKPEEGRREYLVKFAAFVAGISFAKIVDHNLLAVAAIDSSEVSAAGPAADRRKGGFWRERISLFMPPPPAGILRIGA